MTEQIVTFRHPEHHEISELKKLWQLVFGDTDEFLDSFFDIMFKPKECVAAFVDGSLAAAGYCLSGAFALEKSVHYIYSMATHPDYRGRGLASEIALRLKNNAFRAGAFAVATLPATESLVSWYSKLLNMQPSFKKGGAGVCYEPNWHIFAEGISGHFEGTPSRLLACLQDDSFAEAFCELGWEYTFD